MRVYAAMSGDKPVGWVRSIRAGRRTWCGSMGVLPSFRRRGIAKAMMSRMLMEDRATGSTAAVLLASHAGALLYPMLGYTRLGTLRLFIPPRT